MRSKLSNSSDDVMEIFDKYSIHMYIDVSPLNFKHFRTRSAVTTHEQHLHANMRFRAIDRTHSFLSNCGVAEVHSQRQVKLISLAYSRGARTLFSRTECEKTSQRDRLHLLRPRFSLAVQLTARKRGEPQFRSVTISLVELSGQKG